MICIFNFACHFTFTYFICVYVASTEMTYSDVTLRACETVQLIQ